MTVNACQLNFILAPGIVNNDTCTDGQVRLMSGTTPLEGRLEICINRAWGTICSDGFSEDDAHVACNGLGLPFNGMHHAYMRHFNFTLYLQ